MKYLLDTDHLTIWQRGLGAQFEAMRARIDRVGRREVGVSIVSFHEQAIGCHAIINAARSRGRVVRGYAMLGELLASSSSSAVLPFDEAAAADYERLRTSRPRVGTMDLRIAAVARANGLILLTRNRADFDGIDGLPIEDWTA